MFPHGLVPAGSVIQFLGIMKEPKYKLNKKDEARYHELLVRHCLEAPFSAPGVPSKPNPKYPPLTSEENREFECLQRKERRKIDSHPKVAESIRRSKLALRRTDYQLKKLKRLVDKLQPKGC